MKNYKIIFPLLMLILSFLTGCSLSSNVKSTYHIDSSLIDDMAPATDTLSLNITDTMTEAAVFSQGDTSRVARVMEKAANGEDITIAFIGGSITAGSNAEPMETACFAALTTDWWEETFKDANFTYINAGIGATDSYLGAHRLSEDVLQYKPDLVILEFAVNDCNPWNKESYEGIVRHILSADNEPALVTLMNTTESFSDDSNDHIIVCHHYNLPVVNYEGIFGQGLMEGTLTWSDIGCPDGVHPKTEGHALIAYCLTTFFRSVLTDINTTVYDEYSLPATTLTANRYEDSTFVDGSEIEETSKTGFIDMEKYTGLSEDDGWYTDCGGSISYNVTGDSFGVFYLKTNDGNGGSFDVYVDGAYVCQLNANFENGWGNQIVYERCASFEETGNHTIEIKLNESSSNDDIFICGLGIS